MTNLWQMNAAETAAAIREGKASAREVVDAHLARIEEINPRLNAVTVAMVDNARAEADAADKAQAAGDTLGALHGVPVTVKENTDTKGYANTNGVEAFRENIATEDSPVVINFRAAGAIPIARTNTPEFSLRWHASNDLWGTTLNPWNDAITPGGSSGGAGAAMASGIGTIAHGTDLGGSVRYPAYCNGVVALKPTPGRVPSHTPSAPVERPHMFQTIAIQGVIAREVADVRAGFHAVAVPHPDDPECFPIPFNGPATEKPIRIAVADDPLGNGLAPSVATAIDQAAGILAEAGYKVERANPPAAAEIAAAWNSAIWTEVRELVLPTIRAKGSEAINEMIDWCLETAEPLDLAGYAALISDRNRLCRLWSHFMIDYPLILAPVSTVPPMQAGIDATSRDAMHAAINANGMQTAVNYLNLPAIAVPTGIIDGPHGRSPMGIQIIGRRFREDMCLDAADIVQNATGVVAKELW